MIVLERLSIFDLEKRYNSENIYTLFDGLAYNTSRYFASGVVFFRAPQGRGKIRAISKNVLFAKPSNKRFIIPPQKNCYFAIGFYFFGKSIQKHPDSVCENDVNNEQNVRGYYMSNHWTRGWLFYCKKIVILASIFNSQSIFYSQN